MREAQCSGRGGSMHGNGGGANTVKTLTFEKGGGCMTPPAPMVAPLLLPLPPDICAWNGEEPLMLPSGAQWSLSLSSYTPSSSP